ncbi:ADP-ribosylation factor, putative [Babesia caballi]|uniref:ADP-ribosylation factor, putative n=1 Tax=Babesia caballi TaxID=5871 RepID=A0AAV4LTE8_BABCB|nr:ADP-ribosylation factor, putative [Babesia caballi]
MVSLLEKILSFNKPKNINVFLCGLRGSGKTTLLYKSLIKDLGAVVNELEPTTLYHYEELRVGRKQFGIWDFSGDVTVK